MGVSTHPTGHLYFATNRTSLLGAHNTGGCETFTLRNETIKMQAICTVCLRKPQLLVVSAGGSYAMDGKR